MALPRLLINILKGLVRLNWIKLFFAWLVATVICAVLASTAAFYGWWIEEVADRENYEQFFDWDQKEIDTKNSGASALILIEDGRVVRQFYKGGVDKDILFPAASLSKWITALAVMSLVEKV